MKSTLFYRFELEDWTANIVIDEKGMSVADIKREIIARHNLEYRLVLLDPDDDGEHNI